jgi:hypothetical protein
MYNEQKVAKRGTTLHATGGAAVNYFREIPGTVVASLVGARRLSPSFFISLLSSFLIFKELYRTQRRSQVRGRLHSGLAEPTYVA